jgi:GT2 family glycosyltransferase
MLPPPLYLEHEPKQDLEVGWVSGACMLLRRDALGGRMFDERFFLYVEDLELCDRLSKQGWKVLYTPKAKIVHLEGRSLAKQTPEIQASKLRSLRKAFAVRHPSRVKLLIYDVVVAVGFALRASIFGAGALFRPGRGYEPKANESRQFLREALRDIAK